MPNILSLPPPPRQMPAPRQQGGMDFLMGGGGANAMIPILLALLQKGQADRRFDLEERTSEQRMGLEKDALDIAKQRAGYEADDVFRQNTNRDITREKQRGINEHESAMGKVASEWDKNRALGIRRSKPFVDRIKRWSQNETDLRAGIDNLYPQVKGLLDNLPDYFSRAAAVRSIRNQLTVLEAGIPGKGIVFEEVRATINQFDQAFPEYTMRAEEAKVNEFGRIQADNRRNRVFDWEGVVQSEAFSKESQNLPPNMRQSRVQKLLTNNRLNIPISPYEFEKQVPTITNRDGTVSSEETISIQAEELNEGRETLIPTIRDGKRYSQDEATRLAIEDQQRGITHRPFESPEAATAYAQGRSDRGGATTQGPLGDPRRTVQRTKGFKETWREPILGAEESLGEAWGGTSAPPIKFLSSAAEIPAVLGGLLSSLLGGGGMEELKGKSPELSQADQGGYDELLGGLKMGPPTEEEMLLQLFGQPSIPMTRGGF